MKRLTLILMMLSFAVPTWALAELEIHMEQKEENGQSLTVFSAEETQTEENTPAPDATPNPALLMANGLIESRFEQTKAAQLTQRAGAELAQSGEVYTAGNVVSLILRWNGTQTDGTAGEARCARWCSTGRRAKKSAWNSCLATRTRRLMRWKRSLRTTCCLS